MVKARKDEKLEFERQYKLKRCRQGILQCSVID